MTRDWEGAAVVVVAGGPSFIAADARLIGMARARNKVRVIAVNDAIYPCWFADICYACDARWWQHHGDLPDFFGRKIRLDVRGAPPIPDVEIIGNGGESGFDPRPNFIRHGRNSGYQALHIAVHMGAARIILVGFDMSGAHWFGEHPTGCRTAAPLYNTMARHFENLGRILEPMGVAVANASADSKITAFPKVRLGEWLQALEER